MLGGDHIAAGQIASAFDISAAKVGKDLSEALLAELGICQWFHFEDHRLEDAVRWIGSAGKWRRSKSSR